MVDLQNPGLELVVKVDVEAKDLETHRVFNIVGLARSVSVRKLRLNCADCFDDCGLDVM